MLRKIQDSDWPIINKWLLGIAEISFDNLIPDILEKKVQESYKEFPEGFIVSEHKNLNGLLWFEIFPEKKKAFIHAIYVLPEYRGEKISDELINYLEVYCKEREIDKIDLNVSVNLNYAINFYKRRGFEVKRFNMSKRL